MSEAEMTREALAREVAELRQQVAELKAELARAREESDPLLAGGEHLRALAEASPDCVFVIDRGATVRYVNAASARVFGRRPEDLVGKALGELFPPEGFEEQQHHIRKVFETGQPSFVETKTEFPGQALWLETLLVPLGGGGGEVHAILGIAHDITSRRRAEEALEASEHRHRSLVERMQDGIYEVDREGRYTFVNDVAVQRSGWPREWFLGRHYLEILRPEDRERARRNFEAAMRGEAVRPYELAYRSASGEMVYAEVSTTPISEGGRVVGMSGVSRNITDRKRAEEALQRERDRAQQHLDVAGVVMVALDADGNVTMLNREGCALLGWEESEALGRNWFDTFVPEGLRDEVKRGHDLLMAGHVEPMEHHENPVLTRRSEERLIAWHNAVLRDDRGRIVGTLSSGEDITERRRAEEALRESEARFRAIVTDQTEMINRFLPDGRVTFANEAAMRALGMAREELVGHSFFPLLPKDDQERLKSLLASLNAENPVGTIEHQVRTASGEIRWHQWTNRAICDGQGRVVEYQAVGRDITERKQAEDALRHSEAEKQAILDSMSEVVEYLDPDMRIVWANRAVAESLGRPLDQIVGRHCYAAWHGYSEPCPGCPTAKALRGGEPHEAEITSPDGRSWIVRGYPVRGAEGRIVGAVDLALDVTERKRAEQALHRRVELEEALSAISTRFINLPADEVDDSITDALETIGQLAGADRCVLFLLSDDGSRLRPGYRWCAQGIALPLGEIAHPWSIAKLQAGCTIHFPCVADLPPEADVEKAYFEERGVRSFAGVPTMCGKSLVGLLGFIAVRSERTWAPEDLALLKTLADVFASALQRRKAEEALRESEARYRNMVNTSLEGIWTVDAEGKTAFVNQRMAKMLGYSVEEIMGRSFLEFMDA